MAAMIRFTRPERGDVWVDPNHIVYVCARKNGDQTVIYTTHPGETSYFVVEEPMEAVLRTVNDAKGG